MVPLTPAMIALIGEPQGRAASPSRPTAARGRSRATPRRSPSSSAKVDASSARQAEPWSLHTLRHTFVTKLNELGVRTEVVEAIVNHVSGMKAGVAGIYNHALYLPERRAALALLERACDRRWSRAGQTM